MKVAGKIYVASYIAIHSMKCGCMLQLMIVKGEIIATYLITANTFKHIITMQIQYFHSQSSNLTLKGGPVQSLYV